MPFVTKDFSAVAVGTIVTAWTPAAGKRIRLLGGTISLSAGVSLLFEDNEAGSSNKFRTPKVAADTPMNLNLPPTGMLLSAVDNVLKMTSSGAANMTGTLWGEEETL